MKPACKDCKYWEPDSRTKEGMGECRRYAPAPGSAEVIRWRPTHDDEWCGDFVDKNAPPAPEVVVKKKVLHG